MKNYLVKIVLAILIINVAFVAYMAIEGGKYPINLMDERTVFNIAHSLPYSHETTAEGIAENRKDIIDISKFDTPKTKYSKYLTQRSWDMRTDIMLEMVFVSLAISVASIVWLGIKGITVINNKYIVLGDKDSNALK